MPNVLVLYYSSYGHTEAMANAVAEGAGQVEGAKVDLRRVAETAPKEVAEAAHFKLDQPAPVVKLEDLETYDAIVIGSPTRYGRICSQMAAFLDTTGPLWAKDVLVGKVGSAFTSTGSQHGGQETTTQAIVGNLLHLGLIVVGLPYSFKGQLAVDEVGGGSPWGAGTIAGRGDRQPTATDLDAARFQGKLVAETAKKLFG